MAHSYSLSKIKFSFGNDHLIKSDLKWKAHFHCEFTKDAHGLRPHMWPVRTCVRTYEQNSKPIGKALYVEWSLEKDPSGNVNFKLWNYPLLNVLFISNQTLGWESYTANELAVECTDLMCVKNPLTTFLKNYRNKMQSLYTLFLWKIITLVFKVYIFFVLFQKIKSVPITSKHL